MGSSFAAGAGADMLQEILRQKFTEAITRQKLAEEIRQATMQNQIQQGQLGLGQQRLGLDTQKFGEDTRQFDVSSGQRDRQLGMEGERLGLDKEMQPVRIKQIQTQTEDVARRPQAEQIDREFTSGENAKNRANAVRIAGMRSESGVMAPIRIQTVDENGNPVTQFISKQDAVGKTFAAPQKAPTRMYASTGAAVAQADASLHQLDKLEQMMPTVQAHIGPLAGRMATAQQKIPGVSSDKNVAAFLAESATLRNATIKAITGAQMSEPEAKRIMSQIPSETDKPEVWIQKAKATRDNLAFLRNRLGELYGLNEAPQNGGGGDATAKALELLKKYGGQ